MGLPGGAASDIALDIRHLDGVVKSSVCQGVVTVTIDSSGRLDFDKLYNELMSAMARTCAARIVANRKVALRR